MALKALLLIAGLIYGVAFRLFSTRRSFVYVPIRRPDCSLFSSEAPPQEKTAPKLTQKEYLIAARNRLFAIEEEIWLHEYAVAHPGVSKVPPLTESKHNKLLAARGELLNEYPVTQLYLDLRDAQKRNMTYAAIYLERLISTFNRQLPMSMDHLNEIAVISSQGQVVNIMRGQGVAYQRLLPSDLVVEKGVMRQFQHPTFSHLGKFLSLIEIQFRDNVIDAARALVFNVNSDPKTFGGKDTPPSFDSGALPGIPFFSQFSPDDENLALLCSNASPASTSLVLLEWGKVYRKDSWAGQAAVARYTQRKALTVLQGEQLFFSYTTSNPANATIVAHCLKELPDTQSQIMKSEKAVWMLQRQDTGGVQDNVWSKVCDSDLNVRWSTPSCHSAGGGDNVIVVEDGFLSTKALSRWKRQRLGSESDPSAADSVPMLSSKRLLPVKGNVQIIMSPDSSRLLVLQEDIAKGHYSFAAIEGEAALDPFNPQLAAPFEMPVDKYVIAFWISPDSTKVLMLTSAEKTREDVLANGKFKVDAEMQWCVYSFPTREYREYDVFRPTLYFLKTYVPFFSQYAQAYNPWAPDSKSFIYVSSAGLSHTPLVEGSVCIGQDKWTNQGATYGTWSRF